jgi:hypothetical protein
MDWRMRHTQPVIPDYSSGLSALGSALDVFSEQSQRRRQAAEYRRQNDLQEQRLAQQAERDRIKYETDLSDRNGKIAQDVSRLVREGRYAEAEALAASSSYTDPRTGQRRSVGFDRGGERPNPDFQPLQLEAPPEGPAQANPYSGAAGMFQLKPPDPELMSKANPYEGLSSMMGATRQTKPSMTMPTGERVEFEPGEAEDFKVQQASDTADRLVQAATAPGTPPELASRYMTEANRIRASLPGASSQHLRNVETMEDKQAFEGQQGDLNRQNKKDLAAMRRRGAAGGGLKRDKAELDIQKKKLDIDQEYWEAAEKTARNLGLANVVKQKAQLNDMAMQVAGANDNAALASIVAGSFTKYAQGGTGVISDADLRFFWQKVGGLGIRTDQMFEDAISGKLGTDKQKIVQDAVQTLIRSSRQREAELGNAIATSVGARTDGTGRVPAILQAMTPNYFKTWNAERANAGDSGAMQTEEAEADARLRRLRGR